MSKIDKTVEYQPGVYYEGSESKKNLPSAIYPMFVDAGSQFTNSPYAYRTQRIYNASRVSDSSGLENTLTRNLTENTGTKPTTFGISTNVATMSYCI